MSGCSGRRRRPPHGGLRVRRRAALPQLHVRRHL